LLKLVRKLVAPQLELKEYIILIYFPREVILHKCCCEVGLLPARFLRQIAQLATFYYLAVTTFSCPCSKALTSNILKARMEVFLENGKYLYPLMSLQSTVIQHSLELFSFQQESLCAQQLLQKLQKHNERYLIIWLHVYKDNKVLSFNSETLAYGEIFLSRELLFAAYHKVNNIKTHPIGHLEDQC